MDLARLVEHFINTPDAGGTHRDHNKYHRQHHQTHQNIHTVCKKTHQFPGRQGIYHDHLRAEPAQKDDTGIYREHHKRRVEDDVVLRFHKDFINVLARFMEFIRFFFFAHIRFYDADRRHIFLNGRVQRVVLRKCLFKVCRCMTDDKEQNRPKQKNCHKIDHRKFRINAERHEHRTKHTRRRSHHHTQ